MTQSQNTEATQHEETPAETLARSAFGFALLALVPAVITWIAWLSSPVSPDPTFAQIRVVIIVVFGLVMLALLGLTVYTLRAPLEKLAALSQPVARVLGHCRVAGVVVFGLVEANLFAILALNDVAPAITGPGTFLLAWWSLSLIAVIVTVNLRGLSDWIARTKGIWAGVGLTLLALATLGVLYLATGYLLRTSGIEDRLRGGLDYRELAFYDDGTAPPTARQFWLEQGQTEVQWLPYSYWTVAPFDGDFINVGDNGLRRTPSYVEPGDTAVQQVFFFGGSTMWGEGARDAFTIPGHVARLLAERGQPQHVVNFGQTGYVSTQDMLLFQMQLALGNAPDVAVFYQGFNDVLSAYRQDHAGLGFLERQRISDVEAGRLLRAGQPVLRPPAVSLEDYDFSLMALPAGGAGTIVERWLANVRLIEAMADDYGVAVLFVWQPAILHKETLTGSEQDIRNGMEETRPGLADLYAEVDDQVRQYVAETAPDNILILSDLFADETVTMFHDMVHITEIGNLSVAEAILPALLARLNDD